MILEIALGVSIGIIAAALILKYWRQAILITGIVAPLAIIIVGLVFLIIWFLNNPDSFKQLFIAYEWLCFAAYGAIIAFLIGSVGFNFFKGKLEAHQKRKKPTPPSQTSP